MFKRFHSDFDFRDGCDGATGEPLTPTRPVHELNFIGKRWNLRIMWPRFGVSLWHDYEQILHWNYPSLGLRKGAPLSA